ncbi:hypothetical protein [Streptomyces chilikensis]|uniref:hypothetical protein n=1 Tax=Streptomyces chilikensis TaxID=1194079 RepID=UPI000AC84277|nr:hypothetical protein [Streptomyces chilikensis]
MSDMLTADVLNNLRLGTLKSAVDDWKTMLDRLQLLAAGGDGAVSSADLAARAEAADWKGVNATVSRAFVTKTAAQFEDAAAQAKSVLGILSDAHAQLGKYQEQLRTLIDELLSRKMRVAPSGTVSYVGPSSPVVDTGEDFAVPSREDIAAAQQRVDRILRDAAETDRIAARALRALAADNYDFTDAGAKSLAEADREQGAAEAEKWVKEIAAGNVGSWSEEKIARFNAMLEDQQDNPGFTEAFVTGLGAEGTLQFWRDLAAPSTGSHDGDTAKIMAKVQDNLSLSLANATHVDSPAMDAWKKDLIAAGDKSFPLNTGPAPMGMTTGGTGPTGFQIMSSLMHEGRFESKFLQDYGKALVTYEREGVLDPDQMWTDTTSLDYPEPKKTRPTIRWWDTWRLWDTIRRRRSNSSAAVRARTTKRSATSTTCWERARTPANGSKRQIASRSDSTLSAMPSRQVFSGMPMTTRNRRSRPWTQRPRGRHESPGSTCYSRSWVPFPQATRWRNTTASRTVWGVSPLDTSIPSTTRWPTSEEPVSSPAGTRSSGRRRTGCVISGRSKRRISSGWSPETKTPTTPSRPRSSSMVPA